MQVLSCEEHQRSDVYLSERLASPDQLRHPETPLANTALSYWVSYAPIRSPITPRGASLSDSGWCFPACDASGDALTLAEGHRFESKQRKQCFYFLSHWMGYDRGDRFPFDFEPNRIPFSSKSKWKPSPRSYPIICDCERKWKYSFLSVVFLKVLSHFVVDFIIFSTAD